VDLSAQSGLLAAIVSAAVAISVLLRGRRVIVNRLFLVFSANLFVHFLAGFLHVFSEASFWFRVDLIASALLPVSSLLFFGYFLWQDPVEARPYLRAVYAVSGTSVAFLLTPWSYNQITTGAVIAYVFFILYLCAYLVYIRFNELKSHRERTRLRYLLVVMLAAVTFVLFGMLPSPFDFLRTWGDLVSVFFLYFLGQSLLKDRLLDIQELLGRGLVLMSVALILAIVFGVLVFIAGGSPAVSLFQTFVASFVILILFEPLRDKVEGSTNLLFFRERYELRRTLDELRREIANIIDLKAMTNAIMDTLYDRMRISQVSIYFQEDGDAGYHLANHRGPKPPARIDVATHRSFFEQLKKTPTAILAETFDRFLADHGTLSDAKPTKEVKNAKQVLKTLNHLGAGICIPLVGQNEILGLWNILDESGAVGYSTEEISKMMAVAEQAGINIENSKMFEKIRERDRLVVLGEMAAGLAHEIRNPLGAIKGAAQYLDPSAVGKDASEFLEIIIEETDRLNQVVNQFLDYSRPFQAMREPTDINQVVNHTTRLLSPGFEAKKIELKLQLHTDLPEIQANAQQLTQVLLNLFNNSVEAMEEGGTLTIQTNLSSQGLGSWAKSSSQTSAVEIQVSDTGRGIPPETLDKLFVPFFTTKERGTGLGLAISQRIVEHHGGEIRIQSKEGQGSTFTIMLPGQSDSTIPSDSDIEDDELLSEQEKKRSGDLPFPTEHSREKS